MVQRMIAVYAFVFALVQMGQQRKTKAFLFTAFGWMEWKIFIINGEKDYHEHTRHRVDRCCGSCLCLCVLWALSGKNLGH